MFRKVIVFLDLLLILSFSPRPLLSMWNSGFSVINIVRFTVGITVGVFMMFMTFMVGVAPIHSDMMFYCCSFPGDNLLIVFGCIMAVVIYGICEIIVLLLCSMWCGMVINSLWSASCSNLLLLLAVGYAPFALNLSDVLLLGLGICYTLQECILQLAKLVRHLLEQSWKLLESELLVCAGIQDSTCKGKPHYYIDTTQRHYPRERGRSFRVFTGHPSRGLLASLLLPDDHDDNRIEVGGDTPDVEELPGNHCICSYIMRLQPQDAFYSFVVYFCERREDEAFYEVCSTFDIPENIREKIATNNSSVVI